MERQLCMPSALDRAKELLMAALLYQDHILTWAVHECIKMQSSGGNWHCQNHHLAASQDAVGHTACVRLVDMADGLVSMHV